MGMWPSSRDPWRGVVETNSGKEGSGLVEALSGLASEDLTLAQGLDLTRMDLASQAADD